MEKCFVLYMRTTVYIL